MDPELTRASLDRAVDHAHSWLASLNTRPVAPVASASDQVAAFDEPLPEDPTPDPDVVDLLAARAEPGLTAFGSPRFYGFVIGGSLPATVGADLLTTVWDQNTGLNAVTPAAAAVEVVAGRWIKEVLGLPAGATVGYVTGGMMASFTCLGAARNDVLQRVGWDVEASGLQGAPRVRVIVPDERHATIDLSVRYLGLGVDNAVRVPTDEQGRVVVSELRNCARRRPRSADHRHARRRQREHRCVRRLRGRHPPGSRVRGLGPRGRGIRALGGGHPLTSPPVPGDGPGRLVVDRRPQVVERAV